MKIVKGAVLVIACVAIVLSLVPVVAHGIGPQSPEKPADSGGGGTAWTVVCRYDEQDRYLGKTCTSGGTESCACP